MPVTPESYDPYADSYDLTDDDYARHFAEEFEDFTADDE